VFEDVGGRRACAAVGDVYRLELLEVLLWSVSAVASAFCSYRHPGALGRWRSDSTTDLSVVYQAAVMWSRRAPGQ